MQIGVSPSALHKLEVGVREKILQYQQQQPTLGQSQIIPQSVCLDDGAER